MARQIEIGRNSIPMLCFLLSGLALLTFLVLFYLDAQNNAARLLALRAGPPDVVTIDAFQPAQDTGLAREVLVKAQMDVSLKTRLAITRHGTRQQAVVVPLTSIDPENASQAMIFGYMAIPLRPGQSDAEALRSVTLQVERAGRLGSIATINGQQIAPGQIKGQLAARLSTTDRPFATNPVTIVPFQGSRAQSLKPLPSSPFRRLSLWIAAAFALAGVQLLATAATVRQRKLMMDHKTPSPKAPKTQNAKASQRFAPLIEQEDLTETTNISATKSFLARLTTLRS